MEKQDYQEKKQVISLKTRDGSYIGHIGFSLTEEIGKISFLSISSKFWGKQLSILLIKKVLQHLKTYDCKKVQASTSNYKLLSLTDSLNINHDYTEKYTYWTLNPNQTLK